MPLNNKMCLLKDLTGQQKKTIAELRERLKNVLQPEMYDDTVVFYKFLKARNFNINQAESMLRKHLEFRKIAQIDSILTDYKAPEVCEKYLSQNFLGYDKEGSPVYMSAIGNTDSRGIFRSANKIDILKCCLQVIETGLHQTKLQTLKLGKPVTQCVYIYDMDKMTLARATDRYSLEHFLIAVNIFQDNYPELLKAIYVINASTYFTMVFPIVKAVLAGSILGKMKIFGTDGWKEELLKIINADTLPACYGGQRTDPDGNPQCNTFINWAGTVPERYFKTKDVEKFAKLNGVKKVIVPRQSSFDVPVEVKGPGLILEWEFEITCHDIGFKIMFEEKGSNGIKTEEVIPMHKFETEYEPLRGSMSCKRQGNYIIVFDNTYSWFNSKEVHYRTCLGSPKEKPSILP